MEFSIGASPSVDVVFRPYDPELFPKFRVIFEAPESNNPLQFLAQPTGEAESAVVMENRSQKDVTALRYYWVMTSEDGKVRKQKCSSDSYMVDVYQPVLKTNDRMLICRSTTVHESLLDHVLNGGGAIGGRIGSRSSLDGVSPLRFEIDMLLFVDGEIAGPDIEKFAAELQCRKPAAEFVARQIRLAETEHRDVTPVLSALVDLPHLRDDFLAHWTQYYASTYLRSMSDDRMRNARFRHLENRPTLPKFYRRKDVH